MAIRLVRVWGGGKLIFLKILKFQLNWNDLLPSNWTGTIIVRSSRYLDHLRKLLLSHPNRVIHNSLLLLFALNALPSGYPKPLSCARATVSEERWGHLNGNLKFILICRCHTCPRHLPHYIWHNLVVKISEVPFIGWVKLKVERVGFDSAIFAIDWNLWTACLDQNIIF